MKFLRVLCVLAIALCVAGSVYAETQSVKVSGDLTMRAIYRNQYDYQGSPNEAADGAGVRTGVTDSEQSWLMTVAAVEIDADLTDNVQTVIRLLNQRDWNVYDKNIERGTPLYPNGRGGYTANDNEFDVMLDLAYLTLKDFIYSPLTLTIGRQNLWFGKGFIVGANLQNPSNNLSAPEYTDIRSFDAIKAVLDYDPWTITGIYSKIYEDAIQAGDDVDLYGVNVGYKFSAYKAEAEGYWFWKNDRSVDKWTNASKNTNDVHTFGLRGSFDPIDSITVNAEGAYQAGEYVGSRMQTTSRGRSAWALDVGGEWRYLAQKFAWKPKVGAEYIFYSGNKPEENPNAANGLYTGWDPVYRGKFDSAIREFVGRFYTTARYPLSTDRLQSNPDNSWTNQHQVIFSGSIQPMESLLLKANYNLFWNAEDYLASNAKSGGFIGQELDLQAAWDYTEDVSFGILAGWFVPGTIYYDHLHDVATDLVGTVKVSF
jgi:hypothetical protein